MLNEKLCKYCGRTFRWRKKWEKNWNEVVFCSRKCRGLCNESRNANIEDATLNILDGQWKTVNQITKQLQRNTAFTAFEIHSTLRRLAHSKVIEVKNSSTGFDTDQLNSSSEVRAVRNSSAQHK